MKKILFLCTGNYYRSRFAEFYFRHLSQQSNMGWESDSRGLGLDPRNPGPLSRDTRAECEKMGVCIEPIRDPQWLTEEDLNEAHLVIAVKETEHRPLMQQKFPAWENRVEYWEVHDLDVDPPEVALPRLKEQVEALVKRLQETVSSEPFDLN